MVGEIGVNEYEYGSEAEIVLVHLLVHSNLSKLDAFALLKGRASLAQVNGLVVLHFFTANFFVSFVGNRARD